MCIYRLVNDADETVNETVNETQCKRERDFHNATKEEDEEEDEERRQITQLYLYKLFSSSEEQVDAAGRDRMKGSGTKWQRFKVL